MSQPTNQNRRAFLAEVTGVAAATVVRPACFCRRGECGAARQAVTDDVRYGMLIDTTKCADGCSDCVSACDKENGLDLMEKPKVPVMNSGICSARAGFVRSSCAIT